MKFLVKTMAVLQQEDKILEQFYNTLANRISTVVSTTIPPNTNANNTHTTSNEQEFNYKMAAHDLISPLANQVTLLDLLKEDLRQVLQHLELLTISNDASIKKTKAALSNDQQVNQPIPFEQLIEDVIQLLGIQELHKNINIVVQYNSQRPFYNNMAIVQSILQNLIQNAVKYSKPNSQNTITIIINDIAQGVEIIVQDTGIGMEQQRLEQLFNQVVSSHESIEGSHGFGLYGVAQYIQKLKGTITATSNLNIGSTFAVHLPTLSYTQ
jgi:signal transduction histidine kinase